MIRIADDGGARRLSRSLEQRQRQHPRRRGPSRHLRASRAPGRAAGAGRAPHGAGRRLRGPAAEFAQRRRPGPGRRDLVHRSGLRHHHAGRGPDGDAGAERRGGSTGSIPSGRVEAHDRRRRPAQRHRLQPGRAPPLRQRHQRRPEEPGGRPHHPGLPGAGGPEARPPRSPSPPWRPACRTASRWMPTAGSTPPASTACGSTRPTARLLGRIATATDAANVAFGGPDGRRLFIGAGPARPRHRPQGARRRPGLTRHLPRPRSTGSHHDARSPSTSSLPALPVPASPGRRPRPPRRGRGGARPRRSPPAGRRAGSNSPSPPTPPRPRPASPSRPAAGAS